MKGAGTRTSSKGAGWRRAGTRDDGPRHTHHLYGYSHASASALCEGRASPTIEPTKRSFSNGTAFSGNPCSAVE